MQIIAVQSDIHVVFAGNKEESGKIQPTNYHTVNYTQSKSNQHVPGITDIGQGMVRKDMTWQDKAGHGKARQGRARQGKAQQDTVRRGMARHDNLRRTILRIIT